MTPNAKPSAAEIRRARADNPKARERDVAKLLGVSEADLVAAHCGAGVRRIRADVGAFLTASPSLGEVMALTRNESAVHETIGARVGDRPARLPGVVGARFRCGEGRRGRG
jgi:putative hemin transport protein